MINAEQRVIDVCAMQPKPEQITDQQRAKKQHGLIGQAGPERA